MNIYPYIQLMRPAQWLKNLMIFFPAFLGGGLLSAGSWQKGGGPFLAFCLVSSATYIVNDIRDVENDVLHPKKQKRPIASGRVSRFQAIILGGGCLFAGFAFTWGVSHLFLLYLTLYLIVSISYSLKLKEYPLVDVFCISSGFLFRLLGGGQVFDVEISDWLFLSVFLLSLFLSFGKRHSEKNLLGEVAGSHRQSLGHYPQGVLETLMVISGASVLVTYMLYVITKGKLLYTVPLCCFGLFRYILIVKRGENGDPTSALLKDPVLFAIGLIWVLMVGFSIYGMS
ncbi:MAG: decaprenyl-phosphate phosphoribosyltransferase [Desulfuromonas sp.]|nr:MAG: decaprenyl-phosphate phosphoribosyltransferase [Desulfuromonas sp.]